jgi:hypothetical protein
MLPAAEEEMLSPLAPSSAWGEERVFSFAAGVGLAALETHQDKNRLEAKNRIREIFRRIAHFASAKSGLSGRERIRIEAARGGKPC